MLIDGLVAVESEGAGYVGELGVGELSLSIMADVGGFFSTGGTTIGGAVTERLEAVHSVIVGDTLSLVALAVDSKTTVDVGLGRVKP